MIIYYAPVSLYNTLLVLAANDDGLIFVTAPDETIEDIEKHLKKYTKEKLTFKFSTEKMTPYIQDFKEVENGSKEIYDRPISLYGTDFQKQVWQALLNIPFGQVKNYSQIAKEIDNPKAYRAVGSAVGKNPLMLRVPCHRIVHKNGSIKGFRGGMSLKETLLTKEGIDWHAF